MSRTGLLIAACLVALLRPAAAQEGPPLRVGTASAFPPYAYVDAQGQPVGFSVALAKAVAAAIDAPIEFQVGSWDRSWRDLQAGKLDLLPHVTNSTEREWLVDFTRPHTIGYDSFFVRKGSRILERIDQARGLRVVVGRSDLAHHELLGRGFGEQLVVADSVPAALRLLASGQYDAVLAPQLLGTLVVRELRLGNLLDAGPPLVEYRREWAFAVRKGDVALRDRLERGLAIVKATGGYERIAGQWLDIDPPWTLSLKDALWLGGGAAGTLGALVLWTWGLRRQVAVRTGALTAEIAERRAVQQQLASHQEHLEEQVAARTAQLEGARQDAQAAAELLRVTMDNAPALMAYMDADCRYVRVNRTYERWFGIGEAQMLGRHARESMGEAVWAAVAPHAARVLAGESVQFEMQIPGQDGALRWGHVSYSPDLDEQGKVRGFVTHVIDVTERRRAEEERRRADVARSIVRVQEEERRRLSSALHDTFGAQQLAVNVNLRMARSALAAAGMMMPLDRLEDTQALFDDCAATIREICLDLRPATLDHHGLVAALRHYAGQFEERTGIVVELRLPDAVGRHPADLETAIFRIVQEALTNCAKHSRARSVRVALDCRCPSLTLAICDDGIGLPAGRPSATGLGLITMRERAELVGGRLEVVGSPGGGTCVTLEVRSCLCSMASGPGNFAEGVPVSPPDPVTGDAHGPAVPRRRKSA